MFALIEVLKYKVPIALPCLAIKSLKPLEEDVLPLACSRDLLLLGFRPWWSTLATSLAGWGGQVMSPISILRIAYNDAMHAYFIFHFESSQAHRGVVWPYRDVRAQSA